MGIETMNYSAVRNRVPKTFNVFSFENFFLAPQRPKNSTVSRIVGVKILNGFDTKTVSYLNLSRLT